MAKLKDLLYSDLARQFELEGKPQLRPNVFRLLARLPHYRFLPNVFCRASRAAFLAGVPLVPYVFAYLNIVLFGLEITPKCEVGPGIFFAHPVGCVIGAWKIGRNATVFQGVNLGALHPDMGFAKELRCEIGDNVTLGAGCKVLGPYHIGSNVTVGANSVVMQSVAPNLTVFGVPARVISSSNTSE